ncbi:MAG: hypothetical protein WBX01_09210 [Nitrososphaeraceae archaeon]
MSSQNAMASEVAGQSGGSTRLGLDRIGFVVIFFGVSNSQAHYVVLLNRSYISECGAVASNISII